MIKKLILTSIILSDGLNKQFSEIELSTRAKIPLDKVRQMLIKKDLLNFFHIKKLDFVCSNCDFELDSLKNSCPCCDEELDANKTPFYSLGIKPHKCKQFLKDQFLSKLEKKGWVIKSSSGLRNNISISVDVITSIPTKDKLMIILGENKLVKKCNEVIVFTFLNKLQEKVDELSGVTILDLKSFLEDKEEELANYFTNLADISTEKTIVGIDLDNIRKNKDYIYRNIEALSKQKLNNNLAGMGYSFEKAALTLLHSPIFPAKQIKGKNIDDGIIFYPPLSSGKLSNAILISVKSSKVQPFQITQPVQDQMRKYMKEMLTNENKAHYNFQSYIVIVNEINPTNDNNNRIISVLEKEFNEKTNIIFLSLHALVKIHEKTIEKQIGFVNMVEHIL